MRTVYKSVLEMIRAIGCRDFRIKFYLSRQEIPLEDYQDLFRIHLDDYPEQEGMREDWLKRVVTVYLSDNHGNSFGVSWKFLLPKKNPEPIRNPFIRKREYEFKNKELIEEVLRKKRIYKASNGTGHCLHIIQDGVLATGGNAIYAHFDNRFMRRQ